MALTHQQRLPRVTQDKSQGRAVPAGRVPRFLRMSGIAAGIAGGVATGGLRNLARGQRQDIAALVLTTANARRLTDGLAQMRGAALKLGQMLSMDTGLVLSPQLTAILARLRDDAIPMPPKQLQSVLNAAWGAQWRQDFARFDVRPFAAASIGQVHRAITKDGRDLAIKVQYPGVRASIDSDIDNIAALLRLPGLVPRGMDLGSLFHAAKAQLHDEADYRQEAAHLRNFATLLAGSEDFIVPQVQDDFCTDTVLAMTFMPSDPVDILCDAPQDRRDQAARALIDLVLRELFRFGAMQTDPNLANYRIDRATGRIVLLDFGAVRMVDAARQAQFAALLRAGLAGDADMIRDAMTQIGYFSAATAPHHQALIQEMFVTAIAPLRQDTLFDFATTDLLERLRDMGLAIGNDRELMHVPPADTLFLHRKIGGMYLLAARLGARVNLRALVDPYQTL
jgi:predicted unusual protein kinase regulating ubiquinone biosynthesis (AarF/ABC1/UbiB family)